jgi:3-deoxy-D-manno-octulosonic-acid transferase
MRPIYTLLLHLLLPLVLLRLLWRSLRLPDYRRRLGERFGRFQPPPQPGAVWIHAVSVGETLAASPLVKRLLAEHPALPLVVTTTTPTGSRQVRELFGEAVFHVYFPYDLPVALAGFLGRVRPCLLVMVETEIWPNLLAACEARGIPSILANARLSERSAAGYARLGAFGRETFRRIGWVAAQGETDAARFIALGVPPERVTVTGSIKFDIRLPASLHERAEVLRRSWDDRPVWVAASTHEGEEAAVLAAHRAVLGRMPGAMLVLVPRHPDRFERVALLCRREGLRMVRRSEGRPCTAETQIFLGDSMGELPLFLAAADAAFVGGSLVRRGGHNLLEPAALGLPVAFGPHVFNFAAIAGLLLERQGARQVRNGAELGALMTEWLGDAHLRSRIGENGRLVVEANRGATERLYGLLEGYLP